MLDLLNPCMLRLATDHLLSKPFWLALVQEWWKDDEKAAC